MQTAMAIDTSTVSKLLGMAGHPNTGDNEAIAALRRANVIIGKAGRSLADLSLEPALPASLINTPVAKWHQEIKDLKTLVSGRDKEIATLRREIAALKKAPAPAAPAVTKVKANADGTYRWQDFRRAVVEKSNRDHDWQTVFCAATGTLRASLQAWRQRDKVPAAAFEAAKTIDASGLTRPTKQAWTPAEYERLASLHKTGKYSLPDLAATLSKEFNRTLTTNSITGAVDRLRKRGKV